MTVEVTSGRPFGLPGPVPIAFVVSALFLVLYAGRVCSSLALTGDSAELLTAAAVWGVPHAPGYPLFTTIAHAFTFLPIGPLPFRVHLTSAVFHAATVSVTVLATFSVTRHRLAAAAAGVALGLERSFFLGSLYAEVFPLNDLLFATLLLLLLWFDEGRVKARTLALGAGIAAAHHMMIALTAPAALLLVLPRAIKGRRDWPRAAALFPALALPPLLAYTLIPIAASRQPPLSWGDVHDARSLMSLVFRLDYGGLWSSVHGPGSGTGPGRLLALAGLLSTGFGAVTLTVAAFGTATLTRERRRVGAALVLAAVTTGPLFAWMNAVGTGTPPAMAFFERFCTMCTVPIAILFGAGVASVERALPRPIWSQCSAALCLAVWAGLSFRRVSAIDLHEDDRGLAFAHDLVLRTPATALLLLTGDAVENAALYVCAVEKLCGDRTVVAPGGLFMPWAMAEMRRRHPEVEIPWASGPALPRLHELVSAEIKKRPVFVYPNLFPKDRRLGEQFRAVPDHLLLRLWAPEADEVAVRASLLASVEGIAGPSMCQPCREDGEPGASANEIGLGAIYRAAFANHLQAARGIKEADPFLPALSLLAAKASQ